MESNYVALKKLKLHMKTHQRPITRKIAFSSINIKAIKLKVSQAHYKTRDTIVMK